MKTRHYPPSLPHGKHPQRFTRNRRRQAGRVRAGGLPAEGVAWRSFLRTSTCRASTAPTASGSAARRQTTAAAVSVASAGDVNGDGFADLIVGAPLADPHGTVPARAMWCSARRRALPPTSTCRASTAPTASSSAAWRHGDYSGRSVASAGDVNGDGFADLIVGAYGRRSARQLLPARAMWCSARPRALPPTSTCRASTAATASSSAAWRRTT